MADNGDHRLPQRQIAPRVNKMVFTANPNVTQYRNYESECRSVVGGAGYRVVAGRRVQRRDR